MTVNQFTAVLAAITAMAGFVWGAYRAFRKDQQDETEDKSIGRADYAATLLAGYQNLHADTAAEIARVRADLGQEINALRVQHRQDKAQWDQDRRQWEEDRERLQSEIDTLRAKLTILENGGTP